MWLKARLAFYLGSDHLIFNGVCVCVCGGGGGGGGAQIYTGPLSDRQESCRTETENGPI